MHRPSLPGSWSSSWSSSSRPTKSVACSGSRLGLAALTVALLLLPSLACKRATAPAPAADAALPPVVLDVPSSLTPAALHDAATADGGPDAGPAGPEEPREALTARTYDVLLVDSMIYRATTAGIVIEDAAEPEKPKRLGVLMLPGSVNDLAWLGRAGTALVVAAAAGPEGVVLADVSDPSNPVEVGRFAVPGGAAMGLAYAAPLLYVAGGAAGVLVLDARDPAHPRAVGGASLEPAAGETTAAAVPCNDGADGGADGAACGAAADGGIAALAQPAYARDVAVAGGHLFVAAGFAGLLVFDIRGGSGTGEPFALAPRVRFDTPGDARAVAADGDTAWVADGPAGLAVIDTDLRGAGGGPRLVATVPTPDICRGVALDIGHDKSLFPPAAYLSVGDRGLWILGIADAATPQKLGTLVPKYPVNRATVGPNGVILLANDSAGLMIVDASDPAAVRQIFPAPAH